MNTNIQKNNITSFIEEISTTKSQLKISCQEPIGHIITMSLKKYVLNYSPSLGVIGIKSDSIKTLFSNPDGIKEDIFTLLRNIKNLKFVLTDEIISNYKDEMIISISSDNEKQITVSDINSNIKILNPNDEVICNFSKSITIELLIALGKGFHSSATNEKIFKCSEKDFLSLDTNFSRNILIESIFEDGILTINIESLNGTSPVQILKQGFLFFNNVFSVLKGSEYISEINIKEEIKEKILSLELLKNQGHIPKIIYKKLLERNIKEIGDLSVSTEKELKSGENYFSDREILFIKKLLANYDLELIEEDVITNNEQNIK